jgi:hypothetical protein
MAMQVQCKAGKRVRRRSKLEFESKGRNTWCYVTRRRARLLLSKLVRPLVQELFS